MIRGFTRRIILGGFFCGGGGRSWNKNIRRVDRSRASDGERGEGRGDRKEDEKEKKCSRRRC